MKSRFALAVAIALNLVLVAFTARHVAAVESVGFFDTKPIQTVPNAWRFEITPSKTAIGLLSVGIQLYFSQQTADISIDYDYNGPGIDYTIASGGLGPSIPLYTRLYGYINGWDGSDLNDGTFSGTVYVASPLDKVQLMVSADSFVRSPSGCDTRASTAYAFQFPEDSNLTPYFRFKDLYPSTWSIKTWRNTYHSGVDYHVADSASIYAVGDGVVARNKWDAGGFGNYVLIAHILPDGSTVYSLYAHLADTSGIPPVGCAVTKGQVIGHEGATGKGAGGTVHLHFELRKLSGVEPWNTNPYPVVPTEPSHDINNFYDPDTFIPQHGG